MKQILVLVACFLVISKSAMAVDPGLNWKTIESEHLYVHYAEANKDIAETVLARTEAAHLRLTKELNWIPREKTHVILSDESDLPNGFATPIYFNRTVVYLAPSTRVDTLEDFDDWLSTIILHEYTHIIHLDKSAGSPEYLRNIFGRFILLFPNLFQPSWMIEGLATYKETDIERGIGRGQSTMFASMMREELANGLQPVSHVNLPVTTWPAGTTRYLYGVYFMEFLTEQYGEDKLQEWIEEYSNNLFPFFINTTAGQSLGKNITPLWQEFQQWLNEKFQPQIDAIKAKGIKAGRQLSMDAYRTDSVRAVATKRGDEVYYVRNGGYKRASLMFINADGNTEELIDLNNAADLDVHPEAGLLLTQNEFCNNYTIYKDIYLYDKSKNKLKRLTECGRYLFASWFPDGKQIIAVHHDAGRFDLQLLDENAQFQEVFWRAANGEILGQIDVSPDGKKVVTSMWRKGYGWNLELFDIENKTWRKITRGVSITANPQFDPDGDILFSLEKDGVYNLHRYVMASGKIEQMTNLIGGAFQSSQASNNGAIYYAGYTARGYAIYKLDRDKPSDGNVRDSNAAVESECFADEYLQLVVYSVGTHQQTDYSAVSNKYPCWWFPVFNFTDQPGELGITTLAPDALGIHNYSLNIRYDAKLNKTAGRLTYFYADGFPDMDERSVSNAVVESEYFADDRLQIMDYSVGSHQQTDYSALSNMYPRWWFPTLNFTDQRSELGITTLGSDALGIHNYSISISYDTKLNKPAGGLTYAYADRFLISAVRTNEIVLDANADLNRISNRDIAGVILAFPNRRMLDQTDLLFSVIYDKTSDDELAVSAIPAEDFEDHLLGIAWLYDSADINPLSISLNDGMNLRLVAEDSDLLNSDFSGQVYTLDWRQYIRTGKESVFALRFLQGWGTDEPREFKLGGEGFSDNVVNMFLGFNNNEGVFNQREYALRGYKEGLPQLQGRRAQLLTAEWRFPLQRLEKGLMAPPAGLMQWFATVFAETGSAYQDSPDTYYSSAGFELIADVNLFYNLTLRTRVGYAHGFDKDIGDDRVYLTIGSSF